MKNKTGTLVIILLLSFWALLIYLFDKNQKQNTPTEELIEEPVNDTLSLSLKDSIQVELAKYSFKYPDIVLAQAILETGNFQSKVFRENNNLFGMKKAYKRLHSIMEVKNNYAYFNHWSESIIDRALFEARYLHHLTREEYLSYLNRNYAEDPKYIQKIERLCQNNQ